MECCCVLKWGRWWLHWGHDCCECCQKEWSLPCACELVKEIVLLMGFHCCCPLIVAVVPTLSFAFWRCTTIVVVVVVVAAPSLEFSNFSCGGRVPSLGLLLLGGGHGRICHHSCHQNIAAGTVPWLPCHALTAIIA